MIHGKLQSPSLILAHEMKHLYDQLKDRKKYLQTLRHANTKLPGHDREVTNDNEKSALAAEKHTAMTKGIDEPYRDKNDCHKGGTPVPVRSVTEHTKVIYDTGSNIPRRVTDQ